MDPQEARKYQIWSNSGQARAAARASGATPSDPNRRGQYGQQKGIALSAAQRADLGDVKTSMLMYGYGLPLNVALEGVCALPNGGPTKCKTTRISSDSVDILLDQNLLTSWFIPREKLPKGSNLQLKLKEVGSISGAVTSQDKTGFRLSVDKAQRHDLGVKLVDIAVRRGMGFTTPIGGGGSVSWIEPYNKTCNFIDQTNTLRRGTIVSLSQTEALIRAQIIPPIRANISFRGPRRPAAEVINTYEIGFMARFSSFIPKEEFSLTFKLSDL